jgi:hypothetical protein
VDNTIYIVDSKKKIRGGIVQTGSIETVEEAIWMDSSHLMLLGYHDNKGNNIVPCIWYININCHEISLLSFKQPVANNGKPYFFHKYKNVVFLP